MKPRRLSRKQSALRRRALLGGWLCLLGVVVVRAGYVQVVDGARWSEIARQQHNMSRSIAAARGSIRDRDGAVMAMSLERYTLGIAPHELKDREGVAEALVGLPRTLD